MPYIKRRSLTSIALMSCVLLGSSTAFVNASIQDYISFDVRPEIAVDPKTGCEHTIIFINDVFYRIYLTDPCCLAADESSRESQIPLAWLQRDELLLVKQSEKQIKENNPNQDKDDKSAASNYEKMPDLNRKCNHPHHNKP